LTEIFKGEVVDTFETLCICIRASYSQINVPSPVVLWQNYRMTVITAAVLNSVSLQLEVDYVFHVGVLVELLSQLSSVRSRTAAAHSISTQLQQLEMQLHSTRSDLSVCSSLSSFYVSSITCWPSVFSLSLLPS